MLEGELDTSTKLERKGTTNSPRAKYILKDDRVFSDRPLLSANLGTINRTTKSNGLQKQGITAAGANPQIV